MPLGSELLAGFLRGFGMGGWTPSGLADVVSPLARKRREVEMTQLEDLARGLGRLAQGFEVPGHGRVTSLTELGYLPNLGQAIQTFGPMEEWLAATKAGLERTRREEDAIASLVDTYKQAAEAMGRLQGAQAGMELDLIPGLKELRGLLQKLEHGRATSALDLLPLQREQTAAELTSQRDIAQMMPDLMRWSIFGELLPGVTQLAAAPEAWREFQMNPIASALLKLVNVPFKPVTPGDARDDLTRALIELLSQGSARRPAKPPPGAPAERPAQGQPRTPATNLVPPLTPSAFLRNGLGGRIPLAPPAGAEQQGESWIRRLLRAVSPIPFF